MSKFLVHIMLGFSVLLAASCSMPETKIYSLYVPQTDIHNTQAKKPATFFIKVQAPRYLSQPYVAHRISPYQLDISRYEKWDASPAEMVRDLVRDAFASVYDDVRISHSVAEGALLLNIHLKRFELVEGSTGALDFDVILSSSEGRKIHGMSVRKNVQLETRDVAGLAKGLSGALSDAVREILSELSAKL